MSIGTPPLFLEVIRILLKSPMTIQDIEIESSISLISSKHAHLKKSLGLAYTKMHNHYEVFPSSNIM